VVHHSDDAGDCDGYYDGGDDGGVVGVGCCYYCWMVTETVVPLSHRAQSDEVVTVIGVLD
jgi:hypothetical protein